jgi:[protein-PII] uridylyltransferase
MASAPLGGDDEFASAAQVVDFLETMPARYRESFGGPAVRQHARIAHERAGQPAHVGRFAVDQPEGPALCVIALDAPGVLAAISASLMIEGFDVMQAEAFIRTNPAGESEAVDLFWVRRGSADRRGPLTEDDALAVRATLVPLLRGEVGTRRRARSSRNATPAATETAVRFIEREEDPWLTLDVHTNDRSGLLFVITSSLLGENVQITQARIRTDGTRVHDRFDLVQADGTRIPRGRLQRIQLAVLAAMDGY